MYNRKKNKKKQNISQSSSPGKTANQSRHGFTGNRGRDDHCRFHYPISRFAEPYLPRAVFVSVLVKRVHEINPESSGEDRIRSGGVLFAAFRSFTLPLSAQVFTNYLAAATRNDDTYTFWQSLFLDKTHPKKG